jgi:transcriptional regulator with XRE-family HTH domain
MDIKDHIAKMDERLSVAGVSASEVCRVAGVARSTWTRWKSGDVSPNTATLAKVSRVVEGLIAGRAVA